MKVELQRALQDKLDATPVSNDVEQEWLTLSRSITSTASDVLGLTKPGLRRIPKITWFWSNEVQSAVRSKKAALFFSAIGPPSQPATRQFIYN